MHKVIPLLLLTLHGVLAKVSQPHPDIQRVPENGLVEIQSNGEDDPRKLSCNPTGDQDPSSFRWYKVDPSSGDEVEVTNSVEYTIVGGELTLKSDGSTSGDIFRCKLDEEKSADFKIVNAKDPEVSSKFVLFRVDKFLRSYSVVEKEDLKINCMIMNRSADGFDMNDLTLKWYVWETIDDVSFEATAGNCSQESMSPKWKEITEFSDKEEPHIKFLTREGLAKATLKIEDAVKSDRRGYKCVAYNTSNTGDDMECSESVFFVRVKDKYAALWPFLGIVAEVVVLLVCILIAEKRRASKEAAEDEEEEDGAVGPGSNPNGDKNTVRQRRQ